MVRLYGPFRHSGKDASRGHVRRRYALPPVVALTLILIHPVGVITAQSPDPDQGLASPLTPVPSASSEAPVRSSPVPLAGDPSADLWLRQKNTLMRVDGVTGALTGTIDAAAEHCDWQATFGPFDGAMWLTSTGAPGYVSQMDQVMGVQADPDERFCVGRFPIDGGPAQIFPVEIKPDTGLFVGDATGMDGSLWLSASTLPADGGTIGQGNTALYRLDPTVGTLEKVVPGVLAVTAANGELYVVHDPKKSGFLRAGVIHDGSDRIEDVDFGLKKYDSVDAVDAGDGLVTFAGALYDKKAKTSSAWGATLFSVDPATGRTFRSASMKPGDGAFGSVVPDSNGIFALDRDIDGLAFIPAVDGAKPRRVGERCKSAKSPESAGCDLRIVGTTPGAVWVARQSWGKQRKDIVAVYERYDRATGELTQSVGQDTIVPAP